MPEWADSWRAKPTASSLMSTSRSCAAPSRFMESVSCPELHWRWTTDIPVRSPRSAVSSAVSWFPPSRKNRAWPALWLLCALVASFQERRFCSWRTRRASGGAPPAANRVSIMASPIVAGAPTRTTRHPGALPWTQHHAILVGQERRLAHEPEPGPARVPEEGLARDPALERRAARGPPGVEVDVHQPSAGSQESAKPPEVSRPAREVVIRVHDQDEIAGARGQERVVVPAQPGRGVGGPPPAGRS